MYVQVASHKKAAAATAAGKFKDEIIPVVTKVSFFFFALDLLILHLSISLHVSFTIML